MSDEIVVIGFPKCGTTALIQWFEADPGITVLRNPGGALEVTWPGIKSLATDTEPRKIRAHKFTAYIYKREALTYLASVNSQSIIVLCIRDPLKSLISWHRMHLSIAHSGNNPRHFAYRDRDFYGNCTITDYYKRFAQRRLRYTHYFETLVSIVPKARIVIVSQERMAQGIDAVGEYLKSLTRGEAKVPKTVPDELLRHKGYADTALTAIEDNIRKELKAEQHRLYKAIRESGIRSCI